MDVNAKHAPRRRLWLGQSLLNIVPFGNIRSLARYAQPPFNHSLLHKKYPVHGKPRLMPHSAIRSHLLSGNMQKMVGAKFIGSKVREQFREMRAEIMKRKNGEARRL
ncbi:hypothetical protein [Noviherbaspirillum sedimenti]|uniref:hypothetical protein n=1 Tax=Noviherbaspirillum sedimenti TaxID=2320865 RepID=UPI0011C4320B|nr:hypothetical protein [Noviherbaspirillum sedimenti]